MENSFVYPFTLTKVINGDTIEGYVDLGFGISTKQRFRLQGIIAPSLRSRDKSELERAKAAKMWLQSRLVKKQIFLRSHKTPKFSKFLASIFVDGSNINDELLATGHATKFGNREIEG